MKCLGCFKTIPDGSPCPHCGYDYKAEAEKRAEKNALPGGWLLGGRYYLGKLLGAGGFGITYLAEDLKVPGSVVAVKEFYPAQFCKRGQDGRVIPQHSHEVYQMSVTHFYEEAKILNKLSDSTYVVKVGAFLKANNTAYIIMEYLPGQSLGEYMKLHGNRLPYGDAKEVIVCIALALGEVHRANIVHSDISPSNILLNKGDVKLIDFGASKSVFHENQNALTVQLKPAYAPPEQYPGSKMPLGPWTDIYALACTFYRCITGKNVPSVEKRNAGVPVPPITDFLPEAERHVARTIEKALELNPQKRYQTVHEFILDLTNYKSQPQNSEGKPPRHPADDTSIEVQSVPIKLNVMKKLFGAVKNAFHLPAAKQAAAYVEVYKGDNAGARLELKPGTQYKIGREFLTCDLVVSQKATISRVHCLARYNMMDHTVLLEDTSSNGTCLENGYVLKHNSVTIDRDCFVSLASGDVVLKILIQKEGN